MSNEVRERLILIYDRMQDSASALQLMEGATPEFLKGLVGSGELSDALRRNPEFERQIQ